MADGARAPLRIVLATVGSRGDVQPMLALAQVLAARGHRVLLAAPPDFEGWVRGFGIDFAPLGIGMRAFMDAHPETMHNGSLKGLRTIREFLREQIPRHARELERACEGAHFLLFAGLVFVGPTLAERLRLPVAGVLYTSTFIPSPAHPPITVPWRGLPRWANRLLWKLDAFTIERLVGRPVAGVREQWGLPRVGLKESLWRDSIVQAFDSGVFPVEADVPTDRFLAANYLFLDDPAPLDPSLRDWIADGEAPVFIGFGSMHGEGAARAGRAMVEALRSVGRRCLVGSGWAGLGAGGGLPAGWRVVGDAPHGLLFPLMAAVVHHGGSGTTAQALRAGVPQVILPFILDQFHHAHVLHRAGLVPKPVPVLKVTASKLAAAIEAALASPAGPRAAVAQRLREGDARVVVAQWLEARCQPRAVDHQLPEATTSESSWISPS